jgi:hypothetical protein
MSRISIRPLGSNMVILCEARDFVYIWLEARVKGHLDTDQDANNCSSPTSPCRYEAVAVLPLRCSYCCNGREHEFLDLREFLRVNELLLAVQENSLVLETKNTVTRAVPGTEIYTIYWATPRAEVLYALLSPLPEPKCRLGAGNKTLSLRKLVLLPPNFQIIPNSCDLLLIFPCLCPTFLGRLFSRDYGDGLYGSCPSEGPFQGGTFRLTSARLLGDSIPREEQNETKFHTRNR